MAGHLKHQSIMYGFNLCSAPSSRQCLVSALPRRRLLGQTPKACCCLLRVLPKLSGSHASSPILLLTPLTGGDFIGPLVGYLRKNGERFGAWLPTLKKVSNPGPPLLAILTLASEAEQPKCYAVRNGDMGPTEEPDQLDKIATAMLTAYHILLFATKGPDSEEPRFVHDLLKTEQDGYYHGFHADDWFRAIFAMKFFNDRRRKNPIDVARGQFPDPAGGFTLYSKSRLDTRAVVKDNISTSSQAAAMTSHSTALTRQHIVLPRIPKLFSESGTDIMIRRATARSTYAAGLVKSISLSMQTKQSITAQTARTRALGERFEDITPLCEQQALDIIDTLRMTTPAGTVMSVKGKAVDLFSNALGNDAIAHLDAHQNHEEAMLTIDAAHQGETRHRALPEIRRVMKNMAATAAAMLDTLEEREMDWPEALKLLEVAFDVLMADETFVWSRIPIPAAAKDFRARAHQVVVAKAMLYLMVSLLRAGVLTSDVGMGKTFSAILVIIMVYYMALDRQKLNLPVDAGACLWITQANLLVQTFREIKSFMSAPGHSRPPQQPNGWRYRRFASAIPPSPPSESIWSPAKTAGSPPRDVYRRRL